MPDAVIRMRTSPGPGCGSGISPTVKTCLAGPFFSYQAALTEWLPLYAGSGTPCQRIHLLRLLPASDSRSWISGRPRVGSPVIRTLSVHVGEPEARVVRGDNSQAVDAACPLVLNALHL